MQGRALPKRLAIMERAHHKQFREGRTGLAAGGGGDGGDRRRIFLPSPEGHQGPHEFGIIGNDQDLAGSHRFSCLVAFPFWSCSASSTRESSRLKLMPRLTAPSVFLVRFRWS